MSLEKFVDALPIPSVLRAVGKCEGIPYYEVTMKQVKQKLHRDLPPTTVWGYNGMYPGPTFEVRRIQPIFVKWENKLPFEHLLPVDRTIHGAERFMGQNRINLLFGQLSICMKAGLDRKMTDIQKHGLHGILIRSVRNSCMMSIIIQIASGRQRSGIMITPLASLV